MTYRKQPAPERVAGQSSETRDAGPITSELSARWSALNNLQVGRYAEYFVKMEFSSYGFQVFTSEVGIDLVIRDDEGHFYEVQVKSVRGPGPAYVFATKTTAEGRPAFDAENRAL